VPRHYRLAPLIISSNPGGGYRVERDTGDSTHSGSVQRYSSEFAGGTERSESDTADGSEYLSGVMQYGVTERSHSIDGMRPHSGEGIAQIIEPVRPFGSLSGVCPESMGDGRAHE